MFGEVYDADAKKLSPYVRKTEMNSVLDFTFQSAAAGFAGGNSAKTLSTLFSADDYFYTTANTSADALPTFLGNHGYGAHWVLPEQQQSENSNVMNWPMN